MLHVVEIMLLINQLDQVMVMVVSKQLVNDSSHGMPKILLVQMKYVMMDHSMVNQENVKLTVHDLKALQQILDEQRVH